MSRERLEEYLRRIIPSLMNSSEIVVVNPDDARISAFYRNIMGGV
jgi:hypothetical protein